MAKVELQRAPAARFPSAGSECREPALSFRRRFYRREKPDPGIQLEPAHEDQQIALV